MDKNSKIFVIVAVISIAVAIGAVLFMMNKLKQKDAEMEEMVEQMEYEKEELENEYADVAIEMEGISNRVTNDSLLNELNKQQMRVQSLLEELRTVKATNARRISELKKELATVRSVLQYYVAQVDSLQRVNGQLVAENEELGQKYQEAAGSVVALTEEKTALQEKIDIASQLEVRNIVIEPQTKRGGKARYISKVAIIKVSYTIAKNNTAKTGNKVVYMRVTTPDGSVLHKQAGDKFQFEDQQIYYSARKNFEYDGQEMNDVVYYTVTETLTKGKYEVELFVDGVVIGRGSFEFKK